MTASWVPDWSGETVAIIASGESASAVDIGQLKGRCRVIVVNNGFMLAPWADMLYAADDKWWREYREAALFAGIKVAPAGDAAKELGLRTVEFVDVGGDEEKSVLSLRSKGRIARGGNSAFQAVNIAAQTGAKRQVWIGFDFYGPHWHGDHRGTLKNPRAYALDRWARTLDAQAGILAAAGIEVVNCSPITKLQAYRKASFECAMAEIETIARADFDAAAMYLTQAKEAAAAGDQNREAAAKRMVMVALGLTDARPRIHTGHLAK